MTLNIGTFYISHLYMRHPEISYYNNKSAFMAHISPKLYFPFPHVIRFYLIQPNPTVLWTSYNYIFPKSKLLHNFFSTIVAKLQKLIIRKDSFTARFAEHLISRFTGNESVVFTPN